MAEEPISGIEEVPNTETQSDNPQHTRHLADENKYFVGNVLNTGMFSTSAVTIEKAKLPGNLSEELYTLTYGEYRLFKIYLASIDPGNINTSIVKIPLSEYLSYFDISEQGKTLQRLRTDLLRLTLIPLVVKTKHQYRPFVVFEMASLDKDLNTGEWFITMRPTRTAEQYLFFSDPRANPEVTVMPDGSIDRKSIPPYSAQRVGTLRNATDTAQERFIALLSQYANIGHFTISVQDLVVWLYGVDEPIPKWPVLKKRIIRLMEFAASLEYDVAYSVIGKRGYKEGSSIKFVVSVPEKDEEIPATQQTNGAPAVDENSRHDYYSPDQEAVYKLTNNRFTVLPDEWGSDTVFEQMVCSRHFVGLSIEELRELELAVQLIPDTELPERIPPDDPYFPSMGGYMNSYARRTNEFALLEEVAAMTNTRIQQGRVKPENRLKYMKGVLKKKAKGELPKGT